MLRTEVHNLVKLEDEAFPTHLDNVADEKLKLQNGKTGNPKKTIKAPGLSISRTAQACDRCRAKKSKCDGKLPACSSCAAVGIKCLVSDKLSRRAFPKGYTETLEERVRQLEAENTKLQGLLVLRDEQLALNNGTRVCSLNSDPGSPTDESSQIFKSGSPDLLNPHSILHTHHDQSCSCCSNSHAVHERPVSIAGSVYDGPGNISIPGSVLSDDDEDTRSLLSMDEHLFPTQEEFGGRFSFANNEVSPAPGAFAAATAIEQMQKKGNHQNQHLEEENKQQMLTNLVAASIPRSTEETLFIPTLLARICQVYGYSSKPAIITANAIASLKENSNLSMIQQESGENDALMCLIMNRTDVVKLPHEEAVQFLRYIKLPARMELDLLLTVYFKNWGNVCPILNKNAFLKNYVKLAEILEDSSSLQETEYEFSYELTEKLGALMVLVLSLSLLSRKFNHIEDKDDTGLTEYLTYLNHYDRLIHEFIKPNCIITKYCSLQSLQILTLALQYCLAIGDVITCYELRGRVITMAQQLRLHRCPAAVLGLSGKDQSNVHLQNFMQGERRILFWCVYCLDAYASLNLGVPRLLKDYEVECAMPFSGKNDDNDDEKDNENILIINNTKLTIFGKVSKIALSVMQYCKVLGNIMDSVFSRSGEADVRGKALEKDRILDCWRRDLPSELKFDIDVNGFSLKDNCNNKLNGGVDGTNWGIYSSQQLALIFLYYHAKILIYLPIISRYGYHHNVGISMKERLAMGQRDVASVVSSMSMIQQSSIQILEVLKSVASNSSYLLPLPLNIPREQARFALLVAKGSLDYIKGGPLHQNLKQLLLDTLGAFYLETEKEIPGGLTKNSTKLLELAILSILGLNLSKYNPNNLRKKILFNQPITKMAVPRDALYDTMPGEIPTYNPENFEKQQRKVEITPYPTRTLAVSTPEMSSTSSVNMFNHIPNEGLEDGFDDILKFDPFKMNYSNQLMVNEFAADGSLGLVPFLNESSTAYSADDDRYSDRMDDDGAFSFAW